VIGFTIEIHFLAAEIIIFPHSMTQGPFSRVHFGMGNFELSNQLNIYFRPRLQQMGRICSAAD